MPRNSKKTLIRFYKRKALQVSSTDLSQIELLTQIYLQCPEGYTVDHIIPLSKGGKHSPENLQYLTLSVNSKKGAKIDFDYSGHAIKWQDVLEKPSTVIESTPKKVEASRVSPSGEKRLASQGDDDMTCTLSKDKAVSETVWN
jgi:hypothetical protein